MKRLGCPVIDVSNKAIEETAGIILDLMKENGINTVKIKTSMFFLLPFFRTAHRKLSMFFY